MPILPMFPLGSVLFPAMPLRLRVFEERYLIMLDRMIKAGSTEFGVVLIERGQEVGGGEQRFAVGTVAEIAQLGADGEFVALLAQGGRRFAVTSWLEDDPYPQAEVSDLPDLDWQPGLAEALDETEQIVRRSLAQASEFAELVWPADTEVSDEPMRRAWQLAGMAPIGSMDQHDLLRSESTEELLAGVVRGCEHAQQAFLAPWPDAGFDPETEGGPDPDDPAGPEGPDDPDRRGS